MTVLFTQDTVKYWYDYCYKPEAVAGPIALSTVRACIAADRLGNSLKAFLLALSTSSSEFDCTICSRRGRNFPLCKKTKYILVKDILYKYNATS